MFRLPKEVIEEIENYRKALREVQEGKIPSVRFRGIRVPWGIYSHRGGKVYMSRIRIPAGVLYPAQLKALAIASQKFGDGNLHITTRQDIQIHHVSLEKTIELIDYLKDFQLSPRGGGGNTVRNIIACPFAGICKDEVMDVRGYALGLSEYLLRQDTSFTLPRKFKIAFSGCAKDCAGVAVNDLGFLAVRVDGDIGFRVFTGGGMGAHSRVGKVLEDFISARDIGYTTVALKNLFYRMGDRRNKHRNRLRFLVEQIGFEEFRKYYQEEKENLREREYISLRKIEFKERKEGSVLEEEKGKDEGFDEFLHYNLIPQKQEGFYILHLRIPRGDISSEKAIALAELEKDFPGIEFRTTQNQNLAICWVKGNEVYPLYLRIKDILDSFLYPDTLLDVVACKGALTCNLGLCNSPGLAEALEEMIGKKFLGSKIFPYLHIKINGCPNACGHHPVGDIGLNGVVRRVDNRPVPFYRLLLGGVKAADNTRLAEDTGLVPARNIPSFLEEFLEKLDSLTGNGKVGEILRDRGRELALSLLENYSYVPSYAEDRNFYIDWGRKEEFSLAGLGPGECGAGVIDMIESDLQEARIALERAMEKDYPVEEIRKALFSSARALLVVKGVDPRNEEEAIREFRNKFIHAGIASPEFDNLEQVFSSLKEGMGKEEREEIFLYAEKFTRHVEELYQKMDSSFNFPQYEKKEKKGEEKIHLLDLKGTPCPLNYVKAKLVLENLSPGETLEILLDEGEPINNVPRSLEGDGYKILSIEKLDGIYRVLVKK